MLFMPVSFYSLSVCYLKFFAEILWTYFAIILLLPAYKKNIKLQRLQFYIRKCSVLVVAIPHAFHVILTINYAMLCYLSLGHGMFGCIVLQYIALQWIGKFSILYYILSNEYLIKRISKEATEIIQATPAQNVLLQKHYGLTKCVQKPVGESIGATFQYFILTFSSTTPAVKYKRWVCFSTRHKNNTLLLRPALFKWMRCHTC